MGIKKKSEEEQLTITDIQEEKPKKKKKKNVARQSLTKEDVMYRTQLQDVAREIFGLSEKEYLMPLFWQRTYGILQGKVYGNTVDKRYFTYEDVYNFFCYYKNNMIALASRPIYNNEGHKVNTIMKFVSDRIIDFKRAENKRKEAEHVKVSEDEIKQFVHTEEDAPKFVGEPSKDADWWDD